MIPTLNLSRHAHKQVDPKAVFYWDNPNIIIQSGKGQNPDKQSKTRNTNINKGTGNSRVTLNKDSVTKTETNQVFIDRCKQCKWEQLNTMNSDEYQQDLWEM